MLRRRDEANAVSSVRMSGDPAMVRWATGLAVPCPTHLRRRQMHRADGMSGTANPAAGAVRSTTVCPGSRGTRQRLCRVGGAGCPPQDGRGVVSRRQASAPATLP